MQDYDESQVAGLMLAAIPESERGKYTADDMLEVVDMIFDYYDEAGYLDLDAGPESEEQELAGAVEYVVKMIRKDKGCKVNPDLAPVLVRVEVEYEQSLL